VLRRGPALERRGGRHRTRLGTRESRRRRGGCRRLGRPRRRRRGGCRRLGRPRPGDRRARWPGDRCARRREGTVWRRGRRSGDGRLHASVGRVRSGGGRCGAGGNGWLRRWCDGGHSRRGAVTLGRRRVTQRPNRRRPRLGPCGRRYLDRARRDRGGGHRGWGAPRLARRQSGRLGGLFHGELGGARPEGDARRCQHCQPPPRGRRDDLLQIRGPAHGFRPPAPGGRARHTGCGGRPAAAGWPAHSNDSARPVRRCRRRRTAPGRAARAGSTAAAGRAR
jgi:hypothetical protein